MDISRIRKKLKKSKERDEQKAADLDKKGKSEKLDTGVKEGSEIIDTKASRRFGTDSGIEIEQKDTKKTEEYIKAEIPDAAAETKTVPVSETKILVFKVADEDYAVEISELQEILRSQKIAPVPRSPKYLKGITSVRGKILPIIDLKERLGLTDENVRKEKIIILSGEKEPLGILVGEILGVFKFPESELLPPPSTLTGEERSLIGGVVRIDSKFISILKVDEILKMEGL